MNILVNLWTYCLLYEHIVYFMNILFTLWTYCCYFEHIVYKKIIMFICRNAPNESYAYWRLCSSQNCSKLVKILILLNIFPLLNYIYNLLNKNLNHIFCLMHVSSKNIYVHTFSTVKLVKQIKNPFIKKTTKNILSRLLN